jgi:hypothetical protein
VTSPVVGSASAEATNTALAAPAQTGVVPQGFYDGDEALPETEGDVRTPWLTLIQSTTKEKAIGDVIQPDGTFIFKKAVALSGKTGFRVVPIGFFPKFYVEKLPYIQNRGPNDPVPRIARSFEEVAAFGGTDVWKVSNQNVDKRTKVPLYSTPYFEAHIKGLFAIECPVGVSDEHFPYVHEGKAFALALYECKGGSFASFFIPINTEFKGLFKRNWRSRYVNVTSRQNATNPAWSPIAKVGEATSESLQQFLLTVK